MKAAFRTAVISGLTLMTLVQSACAQGSNNRKPDPTPLNGGTTTRYVDTSSSSGNNRSSYDNKNNTQRNSATGQTQQQQQQQVVIGKPWANDPRYTEQADQLRRNYETQVKSYEDSAATQRRALGAQGTADNARLGFNVLDSLRRGDVTNVINSGASGVQNGAYRTQAAAQIDSYLNINKQSLQATYESQLTYLDQKFEYMPEYKDAAKVYREGLADQARARAGLTKQDSSSVKMNEARERAEQANGAVMERLYQKHVSEREAQGKPPLYTYDEFVKVKEEEVRKEKEEMTRVKQAQTSSPSAPGPR